MHTIQGGTHGVRVTGVTLEHLHRHRHPLWGGQQPKEDLQSALVRLPGPAKPGQITRSTFKRYLRNIPQNPLSFLQMPGRQFLLDSRLAPVKPVQRVVQIIDVSTFDVQHLAQRTREGVGTHSLCGGQFRARIQDTGGNHDPCCSPAS